MPGRAGARQGRAAHAAPRWTAAPTDRTAVLSAWRTWRARLRLGRRRPAGASCAPPRGRASRSRRGRSRGSRVAAAPDDGFGRRSGCSGRAIRRRSGWRQASSIARVRARLPTRVEAIDAVRAGAHAGDRHDLEHRACRLAAGGEVRCTPRDARTACASSSAQRTSPAVRCAAVILAIDQGTTGTTCLVFDDGRRLAGRAYREFAQHFPRPGLGRARRRGDLGRHARRSPARRSTRPASTAASWPASGSPTSARRSCAWDRDTGEPLHRAIVWQDRRTAARCDELREAGQEALVRERTGLVLDPYFSGTKIEWLIQARRRRRADARLRHDRLLARLQADRRARDGLLERVAHAAVRHRRRCAGTPSCASCSACRRRRCRSRGRARDVYGETAEFGGSVPVAGHRRRPAGGALRPGLPRAGPRQEHLRHRQLRAPERRRRAAGARGGPARRRSRGASTGASTTRSRRRSS